MRSFIDWWTSQSGSVCQRRCCSGGLPPLRCQARLAKAGQQGADAPLRDGHDRGCPGNRRQIQREPMMSKSWDGHGDLDIGKSRPQAFVNCIQMTYACSASCKGPIWSTSSTQCCMAKAKKAATVSMTHAGNLAKPRGANLPPNSKLRAIQKDDGFRTWPPLGEHELVPLGRMPWDLMPC